MTAHYALPWSSLEWRLSQVLSRVIFRRAMRSLGDGAFISPLAQLQHLSHISIGARTQICRGTVLQAIPHYLGERFDPHLDIANDVYVGQRCTISCANAVAIGEFVTLGDNVYVADGAHGHSDPTKGVLQQPLERGRIEIGPRAWLGYGCVVSGDVTIGESAIVGANSVVRSSVPAFTMAVGAPARVVKRFDHERREWVRV